METKTPRPKPSRSEVVLFLVPIALGVALSFVDPTELIARDWTPEFTDKLLSILPFYLAGSLAVAVGTVAGGLKWFPRHVALTTVAATILALSGTLLPLKLFRDEEARQARILEADMLADSILSLAAHPPETLQDAARAEMRKIAVSMFGEEMLGPNYMKPAARTEVTQ